MVEGSRVCFHLIRQAEDGKRLQQPIGFAKVASHDVTRFHGREILQGHIPLVLDFLTDNFKEKKKLAGKLKLPMRDTSRGIDLVKDAKKGDIIIWPEDSVEHLPVAHVEENPSEEIQVSQLFPSSV